MTDRRRRKAPKGVNATMPLEDAPLLEQVERSVRAQFRPVLAVMSVDDLSGLYVRRRSARASPSTHSSATTFA